jgi:uncharacterized membrane protein
MGCLFALVAAFTPRIALIVLWIFTNLVDRAYSTFIVPLLGLIFLPYATLFYVLSWSPVGGLNAWGWLFVILGLMCDLAHWAGGAYTGRQRYATA